MKEKTVTPVLDITCIAFISNVNSVSFEWVITKRVRV